jgi:hypothetical protein
MRYCLFCIFFLSILFAGCAGKQVLVNKSGNCKLELHKDATYAFKYPTFLGKRRENGTYKILNDSILLKRTTENNYGSIVDCSSIYYPDHPDTVTFAFRNLNDSAISVTFTLNQNPAVFKTDGHGRAKIAYSELVSKKIISGDSAFHSIAISFNNKTYNIADASILPKPISVHIKLNQFIGQKTATLYRKFSFTNDTVIVNGVDPKAIGGLNNRILVKK